MYLLIDLCSGLLRSPFDLGKTIIEEEWGGGCGGEYCMYIGSFLIIPFQKNLIYYYNTSYNTLFKN